jgi:hypothetical protein
VFIGLGAATEEEERFGPVFVEVGVCWIQRSGLLKRARGFFGATEARQSDAEGYRAAI